MTFEQITNPKKEVRVLRNTRGITKEANDLIGKIVELRTEYDWNDTVEVWNNKYKTDWWVFNRSDVQSLIPEVTHKGERIGIGDTIYIGTEARLVYGYCWYGGGWQIVTAKDNNFGIGTCFYSEKEINSHTPLYKETKTLTRQEIADKFGIALSELKIEG